MRCGSWMLELTPPPLTSVQTHAGAGDTSIYSGTLGAGCQSFLIWNCHWHWNNVQCGPTLAPARIPASLSPHLQTLQLAFLRSGPHITYHRVSTWASVIYLVRNKCYHTVWISIRNVGCRCLSEQGTPPPSTITLRDLVQVWGAVSMPQTPNSSQQAPSMTRIRAFNNCPQMSSEDLPSTTSWSPSTC